MPSPTSLLASAFRFGLGGHVVGPGALKHAGQGGDNGGAGRFDVKPLARERALTFKYGRLIHRDRGSPGQLSA